MKLRHKIFIILCVVFLWTWAVVIEPYFLISAENVKICAPNWNPKLDGLKVGLIGDIHARPTLIEEHRVGAAVNLLNEQKPDIILLLGDYLNGGFRFTMNEDKLTRILTKLKAPYGVYAILGNHDSYYSRAKIRRLLRNAGVKILENSNAKISTEKGDFYVAAIADPLTSSYSYRSAFSKIPKGAPVIFLSHAPDVIREIPAAASISFAGHTHGGQVRIPYFGAIISHSNYGRKYVDGLISYNNTPLFINTGIGTSRLPVRLFCPPKVTVASIYRGDIDSSNPQPSKIEIPSKQK